LGQKYLNWMSQLHMLSTFATVTPFSWTTAIALLVYTFVMGYIVGWIFAWAHNFVHKN